MNAFKNVKKLDWRDWIRGLFGAAISGGAGSVGAGFSVSVLDKAHDINIFAAMAITFAFSGLVSLAKYLEQFPVPDYEHDSAAADPPAPIDGAPPKG